MNKNTFFKTLCVAFACAATMSFSSCNMDEEPFSLTAEKLAETEEGAEQLVTGIYGIFWDNWMMEQTYEAWIDYDQDHSAGPGWVLSSAGSGDVTSHWAYNTTNDLWSSMYRMVNRCNKAKESLEKNDSYETEPAVRQLYGEVLFLRAFAYFHLVRMYGAVPLRLTSESEQNCPRAAVSKVYDQITSDLEASLNYLYFPSEGNVGDWGHADKTAAMLLLARVYCTMGSQALADNGAEMIVNIKGTDTRFNCDPVDGTSSFDATKCYQRAKELCDEIISRRGVDFDLMPNYLSIWGSNNRRNKEFIWGVAAGSDVDFRTSALNNYFTPAPYGGSGTWIYMAPNLYEQYDEDDDRIVYGVWHYYLTSYTQKNWVAYPYGSSRYNADNLPESLKSFRSGFNSNYKDAVPCMTKYYDGDIANPSFYTQKNAAQTEQDIILLRFAEAYLLRAEAEVELGDVNAAMNDVDIIRKRSNATTLYSGKVTDKVTARSFVLKERSLELAMEFNRKFDLLRWGLYLNVMNATQSIKCGNAQRSTIRTKKNLLYAIPTSEIAENDSIDSNNYGY